MDVTGLSLLTTNLASCKILLEVTSSPHGVPVDEAKVCECCEACVLAVVSCPQSRRDRAEAGGGAGGEEDQVQGDPKVRLKWQVDQLTGHRDQGSL